MLRTVFLLFLVVALIELASLVWLTHHMGLGLTISLCLLTGFLGATLARRQGLRVANEWQSALASGQPPAAGVAEGILVLVGGALLMIPGILTDVGGLVLLFPPARRRVAHHLRSLLVRRSRPQRVFVVRGTKRTAQRGSAVVDTEGEVVSDADVQSAGPQRLR